MPERIEKLRATIGELESELASLSEIDDETREVLNDAVSEIQTALKQAPSNIEHQSLADRLQSLLCHTNTFFEGKAQLVFTPGHDGFAQKGEHAFCSFAAS